MKYKETKVVNYRQEDDDSNTLLTCTFFDCLSSIEQTTMMDK